MTFSVFGYGSLVNRATLPAFLGARRTRATGLRRAWRACSVGASGGLCALSVVADAGGAIDGLVVTFDDAAWPIIREREKNYDPAPLPGEPDVLVFRAKPEADRPGDADHPIHLSYVDTTLQGFLREFGEEGAQRFIASTEGWHVPLVDDRAAPTYPRAQVLTARERAVVDALLESVDAAPACAHERFGAH